MVTEAGRRFAVLMMELLADREKTGGLSQAEEAERAAELDHHWWLMPTGEKNQMELLFSEGRAPEAPQQLNEEDLVVSLGSHDPPRRRVV